MTPVKVAASWLVWPVRTAPALVQLAISTTPASKAQPGPHRYAHQQTTMQSLEDAR